MTDIWLLDINICNLNFPSLCLFIEPGDCDREARAGDRRGHPRPDSCSWGAAAAVSAGSCAVWSPGVSPPPGQSQCRNVFFVFHLTKITVGLGPGTAGWAGAGLRSNFSVVSPTSRSSYLTPVDPPDSLYRTLKLIKRGNRIFLSSQAEGQFLRVMC